MRNNKEDLKRYTYNIKHHLKKRKKRDKEIIN